jgi:hypothetical protein
MVRDIIKHRDNYFPNVTSLAVLYSSTYQEMCSYLTICMQTIFVEIILLLHIIIVQLN